MYESHGFPTPTKPFPDGSGAGYYYVTACRLARGEVLGKEEREYLQDVDFTVDMGTYYFWVACLQFLEEKREDAFKNLEAGVKYFNDHG